MDFLDLNKKYVKASHLPLLPDFLRLYLVVRMMLEKICLIDPDMSVINYTKDNHKDINDIFSWNKSQRMNKQPA